MSMDRGNQTARRLERKRFFNAIPTLASFAAVCLLVALPAVTRADARTEAPTEKPSVRNLNDGNLILDGFPEIPERLARQLNRYQNTRSAGFEAWTPDSTGVYITTRFGDVSQLHRVEMPGGARHQMTFFEEPVGGVSRQPEGSLLSFSMDEGGSEFFQIFVLDPKTGEHRRLTDGESRNGASSWSEDGQRMAFQSTRRNGSSNDVWVLDIDKPEEARLLVEAPDNTWWGPASWSRDGKKLLIQNYVSVADSRVHLLDFESGEMTLLAGGGDTPSSNLAAGFDHAGQGIFLITNQRSDFTQLSYLPLDGGELRILSEEIPWDVQGFELSDDGRRAAFVANQDGMSKLYLMDPSTFETRAVDGIPLGLVFGASWSPDGNRLAMTLNSAKTPSDVFTLELADDPLKPLALVRWTESEVGGLDTDLFVEPELVHYPTFDEVDGAPRRIPAFVYKPRGEGPHPVIINIHGGPEGQYRPGFSSTFQLWAAELGAATIAPNVRGSSGYGKDYVSLDNGFQREDSVKDIGALLDWIATQPDLDQNRVAVYGGSYGGYMVLASLMHYSDRLRAGIDVVGISSFVTFLENTQDYRRDLRRVEYGDERDPAMRAHLEKISPLNNVEKLTAPLMVVQGQNDPRVPVTEAEQIVRKVREQGYDVWYMNALNEGHGYRKKENRDIYSQAVVLFFEKHLLGKDVKIEPAGP